MKKAALLLLTSFLTGGLWAQTDPTTPAPGTTTPAVTPSTSGTPAVTTPAATGSFTAKSAHYEITSYVSQENADDLAALMEALLAKYNSFFLYDPAKITTPWKVTMYAAKKDFDAFLADKLKGERTDFVYLAYKDPAKSQLVAYKTDDFVPNLAFQGFIQYLWNYVPNPPVWVRNGFAYYFWDTKWDKTKKTLDASGTLSFLDALKAELAKGPVDLKPLLNLDDPKDGTGNPTMDYYSWGLVYFLMNSDNPAYTRLFGSVLANLNPTATLADNSKAMESRFSSVKSLTDISKDMAAYITGLNSFSSLMEKGIEKLKAKDFKGAEDLFKQAQKLRPTDFYPIYYLGLNAYENKDYTGAEAYYAQAEGKGTTPGLLAYARGLNAYYQKDLTKAKDYLTAAAKEADTEYGKLAAQVLDMMK